MKKSTIYHISQITGFSPSTVSRAFSNSGYCSEKTRKIILDAANEIGFRPSFSARSIKSNKTKRILFCIPDICNPFYFDMIKGANHILDGNGYYAMLCYTQGRIEEEEKFIRLLMEGYGDGMIIVSFHFCERNIDLIEKSKQPVVLTNLYTRANQASTYDCVYVDHRKAMFLAASKVIEQGHRNIALIIGDLNSQTSFERAEGFREALSLHGLESSDKNIYIGNYSKNSGYEAAMKILADGNKTAIVAANDLMAVGVYTALHEKKVQIPSEMSVVSLDNTDLCDIVNPPLTSVNMMQEAIGENAAALLMERLENQRDYAKVVRLEPLLVERLSSAPLTTL